MQKLDCCGRESSAAVWIKVIPGFVTNPVLAVHPKSHTPGAWIDYFPGVTLGTGRGHNERRGLVPGCQEGEVSQSEEKERS